MYDDHWNIVSQVSVPHKANPGESVLDITETQMAPWTKKFIKLGAHYFPLMIHNTYHFQDL